MTDRTFRWLMPILVAQLGAATQPMDTLGVLLLAISTTGAYIWAANFPAYVRIRAAELEGVMHR